MKEILITGPAKVDIIQIKDFINNLSCVFDMLLEYPNTGVKKS